MSPGNAVRYTLRNSFDSSLTASKSEIAKSITVLAVIVDTLKMWNIAMINSRIA